MITHSFYESDNRVIRYAETLAQRCDSVEVFALRRSPEMPNEEVISGVRVFRVQDRFGRKEKSMLSFLWPLSRFLTVSLWRVARRHQRQRYDLLHVHNIPDFLVLAAWYPKLTSAQVILDIRDIAEVMAKSDLGVVPKRADSFGNEAFSTKIIEFMSVGVPVVVSSTKIDRFYFDESVVRFFESGNVDALAEAIYAVLTNLYLQQKMVACASEYAARNSWETRKADYLELVDSLCARN